MNYFENVRPISKKTAIRILSSGNIEHICKTLVSIAYFEKDNLWAQKIFLTFLENDNFDIAGVSATCLGHMARLQRLTNKDLVLAALFSRSHEESIAGQIEDAIDDIQTFNISSPV